MFAGRRMLTGLTGVVLGFGGWLQAWAAEGVPVLPYAAPCHEREDLFEFVERPRVRALGEDRYEIVFAVKGRCDVTVGLVDGKGVVVRHLAAGVLGPHAPAPFQKDSLRQTLYWNGKDDLEAYVKEPGKLRVRVQLGLKPEFERRLGGTSPKNLPGVAWGLVASEDGMVVVTKTVSDWGIHFARRFDHDGNYQGAIVPPPANLPDEKLAGYARVEYRKGERALHAPSLSPTVLGKGEWMPFFFNSPSSCMPALIGRRLYYTSVGGASIPALHAIQTDGGLDEAGACGRPLLAKAPAAKWPAVRLASSPDGRWMYWALWGALGAEHVVFRLAMEGQGLAEPFLGEPAKPGSDAAHFNGISDLDCDAQGRLYVSDHFNNRIQVFSGEGRLVKSVPLERPLQARVHRTTGALYVQHLARVNGATRNHLAKLASLDNPTPVARLDCPIGLLALDSWTPKPRLWLAGGVGAGFPVGNAPFEHSWVRIWEEDGATFRKFADFEEEVRKEDGPQFAGAWSGHDIGGSNAHGKIACDPVREQAYYQNKKIFDLRTGLPLGAVHLPGSTDDLAFDKKGYLHGHFNPGFATPGVYRLDPAARRPAGRSLTVSGETFRFNEVPYDYGLEPRQAGMGLVGVLPVRDQLGAKYFQDGIGVNMRGDIVEVCNIYYAPKRGDDMDNFGLAGERETAAAGLRSSDDDANQYSAFVRSIEDMLKKGEEVYFIRPKSGRSLIGGTLWTWDATGELRQESAVIAGQLINGSMLDEEGNLYFVNNRTRSLNGQPFLAGAGFATDSRKGSRRETPFTGTLLKTRGKGVEFLSLRSPIPLDEKPARVSEFVDSVWVEGAEWLYAGASPIVPGGCTCPTQRLHLDWYKRVYLPEAYRHSLGVLDTNGNLILHLGRYGNWDSGHGPRSRIPVGGDGIGLTMVRMVSGTDNYLCFADNGERITVLKLGYHQEESVPLSEK